ncbi:MAG: SPOR domain-containing protein [Pseudomonadota bacterium]
MQTNKISGVFKTAVALGAVCVLGACARDATSDFGYGSLDALGNKTSLVDLGYSAAAQGDHATAIQYFRSAHASNIAYAFSRHEPLIGLGQSLLAIGQNGAAAKVFVKAANAGGGARALRGLAQAQLYLQQPGLAIETARAAVQEDPNDPKALSILGVAMDVYGDHQGAMSVYSDAARRFPGSLAIKSNYGLSLVMAGDIEAGIEQLEEVVRDPRATARDRQNLAMAYALAGDMERATALAAIDLDVSGVRANLLYADLLRAKSPRARFASLIMGTRSPKTDLTQNANAVYLKGDNAAWVEATVRRLVPVVEPEMVTDVPPLMDPTGWAVQIAAYRKLEHLAPGWAYLSDKYASIIGDLEPRRSEVTHPPAAKGPVGFFYRLNAGPLRSKAEADDICRQLKAAGAQCWVRPPTASEGRLPDDDQMAGNAAEAAMLASGDHNAVVNQFARDVITGSQQPVADAPSGRVKAARASNQSGDASQQSAKRESPSQPDNVALAAAQQKTLIADKQQPARMVAAANAVQGSAAYTTAEAKETLDALSKVFDAFDEADTVWSTSKTAPQTTPAPSPGKIMPAMTRTGGQSRRETMVSQPNSALPRLDASKPSKNVFNQDVKSGIY